MCIGSEGYYALSLNENKVDVRAILSPLLKLVKYSIYLPENNNLRLSSAMDPTQILLSKANIRGVKRGYSPIIIL